MEDKSITSWWFLKKQTLCYLFVITWATLIFFYQDIFLISKYIETLTLIIFAVYFIVVLSSTILLITQLIKIFIIEDEYEGIEARIVLNIVLYYGVVFADLYLSTQIRL
jgi:hypothetical protein